MKILITKNKFIQIFKEEQYRKKLDKIILNFFGLENNLETTEKEINQSTNKLEFIIFIDNIIILDKYHLFQDTKKFYLNFTLQENIRNYMLVYPCYWEIYCTNCLKRKKYKKEIEILGALLAATSIEEITKLLQLLHLFNDKEIKDIINKIKM